VYLAILKRLLLQLGFPLSTGDTDNNRLSSAVLWMMVSVASFLGLMVGVRELSSHIPLFELLTLRSLVAFLVLLAISRRFENRRLKTSHIKMHLARNGFHFFGQYGWAVGITLLPLAEVIAIEFTTPIWAVLLASLFLGEKLDLSRIIAIFTGFLGVCIIIRPGFNNVSSGILIVLLATVGFALTMLFSKKLTRTESVWTILMYMAIIQFFIGIGPTIMNWVSPSGADYFWIFLIGVAGMSAHLGLTNALKLADTATILPLDFLRLPFTFVIGTIFYNETGDIFILLGAAIIFAANYFHLREEIRR
jgi:drug/metabolite transporter (DMT)-like permease